jgi:hypothetical protein
MRGRTSDSFKRIPTWEYSAAQEPENIKGIAVSVPLGMIYVGTVKRLAAWLPRSSKSCTPDAFLLALRSDPDTGKIQGSVLKGGGSSRRAIVAIPATGERASALSSFGIPYERRNLFVSPRNF